MFRLLGLCMYVCMYVHYMRVMLLFSSNSCFGKISRKLDKPETSYNNNHGLQVKLKLVSVVE